MQKRKWRAVTAQGIGVLCLGLFLCGVGPCPLINSTGVDITSPSGGSFFLIGEPITLTASIYMNLEAETSFVPCEITWASNVDGELFEEILEEDDFMSGQAKTSVIKSDLSAGIHIITCTADNGTAIATSDRVLIRIGAGGGNDPETTTTTSPSGSSAP